MKKPLTLVTIILAELFFIAGCGKNTPVANQIEQRKTDEVMTSTRFETYVDWWDSNWKRMIDTMPMQNGMAIDVAFDNWGQPLDATKEQKIVEITKEIRSAAEQKNVSLSMKLSFGGGTYPMPILETLADASNLANRIVSCLQHFKTDYGIDFDGIDLDVESAKNNVTYVADFIKILRKELDLIGNPHKIISLTIPGQGWSGFYYNLATDSDVQLAIDCFEFMEYDFWQGAPTMQEQIEKDILTYIGPKGAPSSNPPQKCWGIPASKVRVGLMPGNDGDGHNLSPEAALRLSQFAMAQGLNGVMIWNAFRDGERHTGQAPFAYTQDILHVLGSR
ncbi:MAG: glycoside hydrolase family 18 protein [Anaerolineae bacterium]